MVAATGGLAPGAVGLGLLFSGGSVMGASWLLFSGGLVMGGSGSAFSGGSMSGQEDAEGPEGGIEEPEDGGRAGSGHKLSTNSSRSVKRGISSASKSS